MKKALLIGGSSCALWLAASPALAVDAFPGAEGFGRHAQGGRGGAIIAVTNLRDAGPGSLRACLEAKGPRTCIFRISGVIRYTSRPPVIRNGRITVAGQTAPGGGVLITHAGGTEGVTPFVIKGAHDVVVRHIRVRLDRNGEARGSNDAITIEDSQDVIVDHVSTSWAQDENIDGHGANDNITISSSIFAEGIPRHDKCALLGSDPRAPLNLSFVRNLCAHNGDRNPDVNFMPKSCIEIVNNVFYNANSQFTEVWESFGGTPVNIIGNYYRKGPNTSARIAAIDRSTTGSNGQSRIYQAGNQLDGIYQLITPPTALVAVDTPVCRPASRLMRAVAAYEAVLAYSGAFPRDQFDLRIVGEVRKRTGRIIGRDDPRILPAIAPGAPYRDGDGDGMSDAWEVANGLNPDRNDAWEDRNGNGWANLDEFLDYAHRQLLAGRTVR